MKNFFFAIYTYVYNFIVFRTIKVRVVNDFYVSGPSKWPFLMSVALLNLTVSAVAFFHYIPYTIIWVFFSFISVLTIASLWWWDLIIETQTYSIFTPLIQRNLKLGMMLFIVSEVFFFFSFFWAFFIVVYLLLLQ